MGSCEPVSRARGNHPSQSAGCAMYPGNEVAAAAGVLMERLLGGENTFARVWEGTLLPRRLQGI